CSLQGDPGEYGNGKPGQGQALDGPAIPAISRIDARRTRIRWQISGAGGAGAEPPGPAQAGAAGRGRALPVEVRFRERFAHLADVVAGDARDACVLLELRRVGGLVDAIEASADLVP